MAGSPSFAYPHTPYPGSLVYTTTTTGPNRKPFLSSLITLVSSNLVPSVSHAASFPCVHSHSTRSHPLPHLVAPALLQVLRLVPVINLIIQSIQERSGARSHFPSNEVLRFQFPFFKPDHVRNKRLGLKDTKYRGLLAIASSNYHRHTHRQPAPAPTPAIGTLLGT